MPKKVDLSVIIVSYNTCDLLRKALESIKKAKRSGIGIEVVVVDNASNDQSSVMVEKEFPWVKLIINKENLGFAAANNLGIKCSSSQYALFLNPDTVVYPDTLVTMINFMDQNPQVGASTCRVELPDGRLDYSCHRGFPTPWNAFAFFSGLARVFPKVKLFSGYPLTFLPLDRIHEIDSGCGAFLMVRREAGEEVGWWDEDYFWYGEDLDFCYRLKKRGWKIVFNPETKIIHHKGAASGLKKHSQKVTTATRQTKIRAAKASTQVMRVFFQKHYQEKYPKAVHWLVMRGIDLLEKIRVLKYSL